LGAVICCALGGCGTDCCAAGSRGAACAAVAASVGLTARVLCRSISGSRRSVAIPAPPTTINARTAPSIEAGVVRAVRCAVVGEIVL